MWAFFLFFPCVLTQRNLGWGGVGWGNNINCICTHTNTHTRHATVLDVLLHFHTYVMLHHWTFSCTSTHMWCYTTGCSLALPHMSCYAIALLHRRHATFTHHIVISNLLLILVIMMGLCNTFMMSCSDIIMGLYYTFLMWCSDIMMGRWNTW